jgi:hypothetical protein
MTQINEVTPPGIPDKDVKDMKPSFKKQYGDRWKSVMYATLWKRHNKNEDTRIEMINYIWEHVHPSRKVEENQAILVMHPEQGRQARPLVEMSDNEIEHHYMNIKKIKEDAIDDQLARHGLSRQSVNNLNKSKGLVDLSKFKRPKPQAAKAVVDEAWAGDKTGENATNPKKKGMWAGYSLEDLHKARKTASGTRLKEIDFAIRAKTGWGKV